MSRHKNAGTAVLEAYSNFPTERKSSLRKHQPNMARWVEEVVTVAAQHPGCTFKEIMGMFVASLGERRGSRHGGRGRQRTGSGYAGIGTGSRTRAAGREGRPRWLAAATGIRCSACRKQSHGGIRRRARGRTTRSGRAAFLAGMLRLCGACMMAAGCSTELMHATAIRGTRAGCRCGCAGCGAGVLSSTIKEGTLMICVDPTLS